MQEVILVVPCYNEAERFDSGGFADFLAEQPGYALLFVDDGSSDRTPERLEALRKRQPGQVSVLRLEANSGKGEAVRRGMQTALAAGAPFTGFWDADLATPLCAAVAMRREFERRPELDFVTGCRLRRLGADIRRSPLRHLVGRVFATAASLHLKLPVYDTQCGARQRRRFSQSRSQPAGCSTSNSSTGIRGVTGAMPRCTVSANIRWPSGTTCRVRLCGCARRRASFLNSCGSGAAVCKVCGIMLY